MLLTRKLTLSSFKLFAHETRIIQTSITGNTTLGYTYIFKDKMPQYADKEVTIQFLKIILSCKLQQNMNQFYLFIKLTIYSIYFIY
jgi:hypothetical protein